ncbi:unnamed protein product [Calypogeia fissa]
MVAATVTQSITASSSSCKGLSLPGYSLNTALAFKYRKLRLLQSITRHPIRWFVYAVLLFASDVSRDGGRDRMQYVLHRLANEHGEVGLLLYTFHHGV